MVMINTSSGIQGEEETHLFCSSFDFRMEAENNVRNLDILLAVVERQLEFSKLLVNRRDSNIAGWCSWLLSSLADERLKERRQRVLDEAVQDFQWRSFAQVDEL